MLTYDKAMKKASVLRSLTGSDRSESENMIPRFEKAWDEYVGETYIRNKPRQRKYGGGRKPKLLTAENRLLFILFYFKIYPLQTVIAFFSGMSQSQANERIYKLSTVLRMAMEEQCHLPGHDPHSSEEVSAECPELPFITDGTERRRQRPGSKVGQKLFYSGKSKCHTLKNNIIADTESRKVCYLSRTYEGKKHDKKICDEENHTFPDGSILFKDTGYQGYEPGNVTTYQPMKKTRGKELTAADRIFNPMISGIRVIVEHVISGVKRSHIVRDIFRNTKKDYDDAVMEIACGLHNAREFFRGAERLKISLQPVFH
jgi:hypothetical protein